MSKNAFFPADILLPKQTDLTAWAVVACDQFSSEREYWERVKTAVGDKPSTLKMIVPEAYLDETDTVESGKTIGKTMSEYLNNDLFRTIVKSFIYLERTISDGRVRRGLAGKLDLEAYDFTPGSGALVRASEKTILSRLPARIDVRREALIELPHIMALIDDAERMVIEPLGGMTESFEKVYDFPLMEGGGALKGWRVAGGEAEKVVSALETLSAETGVELIIGDGNHSLAAAKGYWDEIKEGVPTSERDSHPARYALVEINNVYDEAITFEAIHRVVFRTNPVALLEELKVELSGGEGNDYTIRWMSAEGGGGVLVRALSIGALIDRLQLFLDGYAEKTGAVVDYIHGEDSVEALSKTARSIGFILPTMDKSDFFKTVLAGGVFPKKSFSIGHARDKRYYLECREIR